MPNWCFNSLTIEGSEADITAIKQQLNQPYTRFFKDTWNRETNQFEEKNVTYSNPIFSFWNIVKPTDLEAYSKQAEHKLGEPINFDGDNWYDWNVRNWGTKWDVAVHDGDEYPETELMTDTKDTLAYRFNTAWSPPAEAITKLSQQYPNCEMSLSYEEETGWGGEIIFANGEGTEIEHYENKCRDCDSINTLDYCENGCGEICSSCMYMGEADEECVVECEVHREYLPVD